MKICPRCHQQIPDALLVCEACTRARALKALYERQGDFLRLAAAGTEALRIGCTTKGERHVLMYCSDLHTFCGLDLNRNIRRSRLRMTDKELLQVCAGCRIALKSAVEEACAA